MFPRCAAAALAPDGRTIYVQNAQGNILAAERAGDQWTTPRAWLNPPDRLHYFQRTSGGTGYATRMGASPRGIQGTICTASGNGPAVKLEPLPPSINSGDNGVDFFVARDDSFIIFVVHPGGANGDLNIAFRKPDGSWTRTQNLGAQVNRDTTWEWGPFVSPPPRPPRMSPFTGSGSTASSTGCGKRPSHPSTTPFTSSPTSIRCSRPNSVST